MKLIGLIALAFVGTLAAQTSVEIERMHPISMAFDVSKPVPEAPKYPSAARFKGTWVQLEAARQECLFDTIYWVIRRDVFLQIALPALGKKVPELGNKPVPPKSDSPGDFDSKYWQYRLELATWSARATFERLSIDSKDNIQTVPGPKPIYPVTETFKGSWEELETERYKFVEDATAWIIRASIEQNSRDQEK